MAESAIEALDALSSPTPAQLQLLAEYRALEADLEAQRRAFEALQAPQLIERGVNGARDGATGNWFGLLESAVAVAGAAATAYGAKLWASKDAAKQLQDLERRRDESRTTQGIAAATERSAAQAQSMVAVAAKAEATRQATVLARAAAAEAAKAEYDRMRALAGTERRPSASIAPIAPDPLAPPSVLGDELEALPREPPPPSVH